MGVPGTPPGAAVDTTRKLADAYNVQFEPVDDGQQIHGVVIHVIDRERRFAAKFHGLKFGRVNMVLYINGLINNWYTTEAHSTPNLWDKLMKLLFRQDEQ